MLTTTKSSLQKVQSQIFIMIVLLKLSNQGVQQQKITTEYIFENSAKGKKQNNPNLTYALPLTAMQPAFKNAISKI